MNIEFAINETVHIELEISEEAAEDIVSGLTDKIAFMSDLTDCGLLTDFGLLPGTEITRVDIINTVHTEPTVLNTTDKNSWTSEAVVELLNKRAEDDNNFYFKRKHYPFWEIISQHMNEKNYHFTAKECSKKFEQLMSRYKFNKEKFKNNELIKWEYFDLIHKLFGDKDDVHPPQSTLINSSLVKKKRFPSSAASESESKGETIKIKEWFNTLLLELSNTKEEDLGDEKFTLPKNELNAVKKHLKLKKEELKQFKNILKKIMEEEKKKLQEEMKNY